MISTVAERANDLAGLCQQYGVVRLELFGSAATAEAFDPSRSDLDFIVDFDPGRDLGPWLSHYFAFRDALASLFGRPVDLVMRSAMTDEHFIREANRTRRLVYGR